MPGPICKVRNGLAQWKEAVLGAIPPRSAGGPLGAGTARWETTQWRLHLGRLLRHPTFQFHFLLTQMKREGRAGVNCFQFSENKSEGSCPLLNRPNPPVPITNFQFVYSLAVKLFPSTPSVKDYTPDPIDPGALSFSCCHFQVKGLTHFRVSLSPFLRPFPFSPFYS